MWSYNYNNELYHHGVKGMKWGIRKDSYRTYGLHIRSSNEQVQRFSKAYQKQGYSKKDSDRYAKNYVKAQKILMTAGAIAVVGLAAYGAHKLGKNYLGATIRAGQIINRVEGNGVSKLNDLFYASKGRHDKERYKNIYASQILEGRYASIFGSNPKPAVLDIKANAKIKVASHNVGTKVFKDVLSRNHDAERIYLGSKKNVNNVSKKRIKRSIRAFQYKN